MSSARHRWWGRLLPATALRLLLWTIIATSLAPDVLNEPYELVNFHDEFFFFAQEESARRTIVDYAQLPFWDPYQCGGIVGVANPQVSSLSPDFLLRVFFGTSPGRRLAVLLFFVLAMEGLFQLARRHDASVTGAFIFAVVWGVSGRLQNAVEHGQLNLLLFAMMPWALFFFERGMTRWRDAIAAGLIVAWMVLCGGTYTAPYTVQMLLLAAVYWSIRIALFSEPNTRRLAWWAPWASFACVGGAAFALSAIRVLPLMDVPPRDVVQLQTASPGVLAEALFMPSGAGSLGDAYVGLVVAGLAAFALFSSDRAGRFFVAAAIFFFAVALGQRGSYSPYELFRHLPLYDQLRDPYRYVVLVSMFLCLAAARGFTLLERLPVRWLELRSRRRRAPASEPSVRQAARVGGWLLACALVYFVGYDEFIESQTIEIGSLYREPGVASSDQRFRQARGNRWDLHAWPSVNLGSLRCFLETKFPQSAQLRGDLAAEEYPLDPHIASVRRLHWSPNEIELDVRASAPTRVIVNQNYHRGWEASLGRVLDHRGLLAVDVPRGRHRLTLAYEDTKANIGTVISGLAWLALFAFFGFLAVRAARRWIARYKSLPR